MDQGADSIGQEVSGLSGCRKQDVSIGQESKTPQTRDQHEQAGLGMAKQITSLKERGQLTVEMALLMLSGALLVVGAYVLFNPLLTQIIDKITSEFGLLK
jgi:hypothetical protein